MKKPVVEVETTINADPARVWAAMTAKKSAMFLGAEVETDWRAGHRIEFSGDFNGKSFKDYGEIQSIERDKELAFSHWSNTPERPDAYHVVRYSLTPHGKETKVMLSQFNEGKKTEVDDKTKAEYR